MTVWETVGVFAGIPAGIIAVIAIAVFGRALAYQPHRYRPGKPWDYPPSWYVPHPDAVVSRPSTGGSTSTTAVGGASGEW